MALVQQAHTVIFRFRDDDGAETTCETHLAGYVSLDSALAFAGQLGPLIAALSDAVMITYNVIAGWVENSPPVADSASMVSRAGVFLFRTTNIPQERYVIAIPSIRQDLVLTLGEFPGVQIDPTNAAVVAFTSALTDGLNGVHVVAPWATFTSGGGGGGSWGGGGGGGGSWGGGGGGGGPWGGSSGGGGGGSFATYEWLLDYARASSAELYSFILAYVGKSNDWLRIPNRRI